MPVLSLPAVATLAFLQGLTCATFPLTGSLCTCSSAAWVCSSLHLSQHYLSFFCSQLRAAFLDMTTSLLIRFMSTDFLPHVGHHANYWGYSKD